MEAPTATIVIPTKDRPHLLPRALASALAQTVAEIEVIVVDDGSAEPVRLTGDDPRVQLIRNQHAVGVSASRNLGLERARGRWITFLDDDDELLPGMVELSLEAVRRSALPEPVAVLSAIEDVDSDRVVQRVCHPIAVARGGSLYGHRSQQTYTLQTNSLLAPVDVLRAIGGWDGSLKGWEDDDLLLRLVRVCSIEALLEVTYRLHGHDGPRLHRDADAMISGVRQTMARYREVFADYPRLRAKYLATISRLYQDDGQWWPSVSSALASLRLDPRRPYAMQQVAASILGRHGYWAARNVRRRLVPSRNGRH